MAKYNYVKMIGTITVHVDEVDIEQWLLSKPQIKDGGYWGFLPEVAREKEGYKNIARMALSAGNQLDFISYVKSDDGYDVKFVVKPLCAEK